jgi:hypothetical protein
VSKSLTISPLRATNAEFTSSKGLDYLITVAFLDPKRRSLSLAVAMHAASQQVPAHRENHDDARIYLSDQGKAIEHLPN